MGRDEIKKLILARRARYIAAALASMATAVTCGGKAVIDGERGGSGGVESGSGGSGGEPQPCLEPPGTGGMPEPCLGAPAGSGGVAPGPCLTAPEGGQGGTGS